jgi:phage tail sheath protein FI
VNTILRAPGVYQAREEERPAVLEIGVTGVPGFVGLTQKGPTNEPVRIESEEHFARVYGELEEGGYLRDAIRGFFANGGRFCYVLRVAHMVRRLREETARRAVWKVKDDDGRTTLTVNAANEGLWGNQIQVAIDRQTPRAQTFLTLDLNPGATSAVIKSTLGLARGSLVRIYDGQAEAFRVVTDLSGKTISWEASRPLERGFRSDAPTYVEPVEFSLQVRWRDTVEVFRNLSMSPNSEQYVERVVNLRSELIKVEDHRVESPSPRNYPTAMPERVLEGGTDGLFTVTPEDFVGANIGPNERFGLAALEAVDGIDLLAVPDLMWTLQKSAGFRTEKDVEVVQQALVSQCERLKTRFALLDFPDPSDHRRAAQWRLMFDSAFAAFYFPWLAIEGPAGRRLVPPSGHVAGIFSRCDRADGVYRAPANEEVEGIMDLARNLFDADIGQLNNNGINCLRAFGSRGIRIWGARTVSNDPQWRYVPVRRVVNAIIRSLEQGLQWAVFEVNTPSLWKRLEFQVSYFLQNLWSRGYLRGDTPEEAFFVRCNEETNPQALRDSGVLVVECGVAPVRPAEFIVFSVQAEVPAGVASAIAAETE